MHLIKREARRGTIFAAFLKLLPVFIFIIPGMIWLALAKSGKVPEFSSMMQANGQPVQEYAQAAFPLMVKYVMPVGLRGLVVAGLLAALMSSLAGAFNASSTLFTIDFTKNTDPVQPGATGPDRPGRNHRHGAHRTALDPRDPGGKGLYDYLQGVQGYLAPPIFTVFFFGVFMKRLNAKGMSGGAHRWIRSGHVPPCCGHAGCSAHGRL